MTGPGRLAAARRNVTGIVSLFVTGVWMTGLFLGTDWWIPALVVGYAVVVPLVAVLFDEREGAWTGDERADGEWERERDGTAAERERADGADGDGESADAALATLRDRYARGELTEAQFERKLERLLETETVEDVEDRYRERVADAEREREAEPE